MNNILGSREAIFSWGILLSGFMAQNSALCVDIGEVPTIPQCECREKAGSGTAGAAGSPGTEQSKSCCLGSRAVHSAHAEGLSC